MKKKILFVITKSNWGGAQRYVYDLASVLQKEGKWDVAVALGGTDELRKKLEDAKIHVIPLRNIQRDISATRDVGGFYSVYKAIWNFQPDVVHLNSSKIGGLGALAARLQLKKRPRVIFTVHGWPFKENRTSLARIFIYLASWLTAVLSSKVIVVSKEDEEFGKRMWFMGDRISYIPLTIDIPGIWSKMKAEQFLFKPEIDVHIINSVRLVTIAELTENKGLKYGIEMMGELQKKFPGKYSYTIFGEGEDVVELQNLAGRLPNPLGVRFANVHMINYPPVNLATEASRFLKAFHIYVLPSIKEGMPYVLLEAAAAGLPIIATDVVKLEASNLPNIRFVHPKSSVELADAVEELTKELHLVQPSEMRSLETMVGDTAALYINPPDIRSR